MNQPPEDLYAILGVDRSATTSEIEKAYRKLARKHHPDLGGDKDIFAKLALAKEILCDPEKRRHYDQTGEINGKNHSFKAEAEMMLIALIDQHMLEDMIPNKPFDRIRREIDQAYENGSNSLKAARKMLAKLNRRLESFSRQVEANGKMPPSIVDMVLSRFARKIEELTFHICKMENAQRVAEEMKAMVEFMQYTADAEQDPEDSTMSRWQSSRGESGMFMKWSITS